jgi:hypothetical protein
MTDNKELADKEALERAQAVLNKTAELSPKLMAFVGKELIPRIGKFMEEEMESDQDQDLTQEEIIAACVAMGTELSFWQTLYMHMGGNQQKLARYMGLARQKGLDVFQAFMLDVKSEERVLKLRDTIQR